MGVIVAKEHQRRPDEVLRARAAFASVFRVAMKDHERRR
jgi:hypothetical protein